MGTRSLIIFRERRGDTFLIYVIIYQQYNGYIYYVGKQVLTFLQKVKLVNGLRGEEEKEDVIICNGFDDLVARFIQRNKKDGPGDLYIVPEQSGYGEEFTYYVTYDQDEDKITLKVNDSAEMSLEEFAKL